MPKIYYQAATLSYGMRVFVPYDLMTDSLRFSLNANCLWGGMDKDTGKCYSYEFGTSAGEYVHTLAENSGFTLVEVNPINAVDVWE